MENREAIEWLKGCVVAYEVDNKGKPNGNVTCELIQEVIDMAISALKKQEQTKEAIPHRNYQYLSDYWCECGWHLGKKGDVKFCADCGRRIKWD